MGLWFYVQEHPKAQRAVVLVLKRLSRRGHSLKSHLTDWEKPGIEPAIHGSKDIGLSPTPWPLHNVFQYVKFALAIFEEGHPATISAKLFFEFKSMVSEKIYIIFPYHPGNHVFWRNKKVSAIIA